MHYIMSVKDEISEQIEMTDLGLALSDVRSTYNWTLWENEKEKVTMIFESEGDLIEGKLYSVHNKFRI